MHCSGAPPNLMSPVLQKLTWKNSLDKILSIYYRKLCFECPLKKRYYEQNLTEILKELYIRRHQMHTNMVLHTKPKKKKCTRKKLHTGKIVMCLCMWSSELGHIYLLI